MLLRTMRTLPVIWLFMPLAARRAAMGMSLFLFCPHITQVPNALPKQTGKVSYLSVYLLLLLVRNSSITKRL